MVRDDPSGSGVPAAGEPASVPDATPGYVDGIPMAQGAVSTDVVPVTDTAQPMDQDEAKQDEAKKKRVLSPGHLAAVRRTEDVARLNELRLASLDKTFGDKVKDAVSGLELTKAVRVLEARVDQINPVTAGLLAAAREQDDRIALLTQRLQALEAGVTQHADQVKSSAGLMAQTRTEVQTNITDMETIWNEWEARLDKKMKDRATEIDDKLREAAGLFLKCDEALKKLEQAKAAWISTFPRV